MNWKKLNRFQIMRIFLVLMMAILLVRLFKITIIDGEKYRYAADNVRVKEYSISAPRGNIYDRNGKLLAGTKSSFVIKLFKDELNTLELSEKNDMFKDLVYYLEEEGAPYVNNFSIIFHAFTYRDTDTYFREKTSPTVKALDIIFEEELQREILEATTSEGGFNYAVVNGVLNSLDKKGITVPVRVNAEGSLSLEYIEGKELTEFRNRNNIPSICAHGCYLFFSER